MGRSRAVFAIVNVMNFQKLLSQKNPSVGNVKLIAVDGHGGSGKSTLAQLLATKLNAQIIHTDDFAGWDNPENWWPVLIEKVLDPIKHGATTLSYPRSKWWESHQPEPVVDQPVTDIMILEGVTALRKEFRPYIALSIYVDTPKDVCFARGLVRDKGQDGKTDAEIMQMWEEWYKTEEAYIARDSPQEYADLIIDGTKPLEPQLL